MEQFDSKLSSVIDSTVFMVTFDALCPLFTNDADSFRFCIILGA